MANAAAKPLSAPSYDVALRNALSDFVLREARLLDEGRFDEWVALFAEDGTYWAPAKPGQASPNDHVSLFYDDKPTLRTRMKRLRHPMVHVQIPASRVCHVVSAVTVEASDTPGIHVARSSFMLLEYRPDHGQRIYGGQCEHRLRCKGDSFEIVQKRVELINCDGPFPALAIPF